MVEGSSGAASIRRRAPAVFLCILAVVAYAGMSVFALFNAQTFTAEVSALVRGWWYVTGTVAPYTAADATRDMPLYLYLLGGWQQLLGIGHTSGRVLSIFLGMVSGLLLFSICRRLTANTAAAAAAVFIFLATPSTSFFFATATSAALVSTLHLLAAFLIVISIGQPRLGIGVAMGLTCAALYFTRQDMWASIVVLIPLYIAAVGRDRIAQVAGVVIAFIALALLLVVVLPDGFGTHALQLPVIGAMLGDAGLLGPDHILVTRGTHAPIGLAAALSGNGLRYLLEAFILPNAGTLILVVGLFVVATGPLRLLWIAPVYVLWLAFTHYLGAVGICETCLLPSTPTYIAFAALAAALTLAMSGRLAKDRGLAPGTAIVLGAIAAVALNTFAPALAARPDLKAFPRPMLDGLDATPEMKQLPALTRWVAGQVAISERVLVIEGLGPTRTAALPYAVFLAGRMMPAQSLDLRGTRRTINQSLVGVARESVRGALEGGSLWSEDTMRRWIERDFDVILFQDDAAPATVALRKDIEARFNRAGATRYRGRDILLFTRTPVQ